MTEPPTTFRRIQAGDQPEPRDIRIEQAEVRVQEAPVEVHEHIAVQETTVPPPPERPPERVVRIEESTVEEAQQGRMWRTYVLGRRERRFAGAALALALLTVVAAGWLFHSSLAGTGAPASLTDNEGVASLMLLLVVGVALAAAAADGIAIALVMGFVAGLASLLYGAYEFVAGGLSLTGQVLTAALAVLGVLVLAMCTLGLGSWRGRRHEERIQTFGRRPVA